MATLSSTLSEPPGLRHRPLRNPEFEGPTRNGGEDPARVLLLLRRANPAREINVLSAESATDEFSNRPLMPKGRSHPTAAFIQLPSPRYRSSFAGSHRPQITVQPVEGGLDQREPRRDVAALEKDVALVARLRPQEAEHGLLRQLEGKAEVVAAV